jgi:hypothetical protein
MAENYFEKLKNEFNILEYVKQYQNDFLIYAKDELETVGDSDFLICARESGCDFISFEGILKFIQKDPVMMANVRRGFDSYYLQLNSRFFFGHNGEVEEVSKEVATKKYIENLKKSPQYHEVFPYGDRKL